MDGECTKLQTMSSFQFSGIAKAASEERMSAPVVFFSFLYCCKRLEHAGERREPGEAALSKGAPSNPLLIGCVSPRPAQREEE